MLAEIGDKNSIKVSDEEISRAIVERARQVPGREQEVWDYYRKNPQAVAGIRAPIYEEKVVDFLLELAKVTDKTGDQGGAVQGRRGRDHRRGVVPATWPNNFAAIISQAATPAARNP